MVRSLPKLCIITFSREIQYICLGKGTKHSLVIVHSQVIFFSLSPCQRPVAGVGLVSVVTECLVLFNKGI